MQQLQALLEGLQKDFSQSKYLESDPLDFVHRYSDPWDQEAVALISALLAYGNVKQIRKSVQEGLNRIEELEESPSSFVRRLRDPHFFTRALAVFQTWVHRFNTGPDLVLLLRLLSESWEQHGSLGAHFLSFLSEDSPNIESALNQLVMEWKAAAPEAKGSSFEYLLTAPQSGSCCKRWCMFLRWMGRKDEIDPGLWMAGSPLSKTFPSGRGLRPDQLVIPLDTHTGRISQYLKLTQRRSLNWKAALEVTDALKACSPQDPVRYDFALARLGILDLCQKKYKKEVCEQCQLLPACHYAQQKEKKLDFD